MVLVAMWEGRAGLLERVNLLVGVRSDVKYSIHEGTHLPSQVGEGSHTRGEKGDVVVVQIQPIGENEKDVSSIKSLHLQLQLGHPCKPRGYRSDLVVAKTQPIGVK